MPGQPTYVRVPVEKVTHRTAPAYGTITFNERNSKHVLSDGGSGKLLIGPLGVHYYQDGPPDSQVIYLRRWDVPPGRDGITVRSRLPRD